MKILYTLAAAGLTASLYTAEVRADEILHVEFWGQNNPVCGSEINPCRTLGYTISRRANPYGRVVVGPGDYLESVVIDLAASGIPLDGLRIESKLGRNATSIGSTNRSLSPIRIIASEVVIGTGDKGFTLRPRIGQTTAKSLVADLDAN